MLAYEEAALGKSLKRTQEIREYMRNVCPRNRHENLSIRKPLCRLLDVTILTREAGKEGREKREIVWGLKKY